MSTRVVAHGCLDSSEDGKLMQELNPCSRSYILLFPPGTPTDEGSEVSTAKEPRWRKLLAMHDFHETCEPGLPRKGVEPSDHVAIGAVVELFT